MQATGQSATAWLGSGSRKGRKDAAYSLLRSVFAKLEAWITALSFIVDT
jgi:hypothetical protein